MFPGSFFPVLIVGHRGEIPFFRVGNFISFKNLNYNKWLKELGVKKAMDVDDYVNRYLQTHSLKG